MKIGKGQAARIADVIFLGPYMIWFALVAKDISILNSSLMIALGIGTIIYNLKNFLFNYYPAPKYNMNDIYFGIFTGVLWVIIYLIRKYSQKSSLSRSVTSNLTSPRD